MKDTLFYHHIICELVDKKENKMYFFNSRLISFIKCYKISELSNVFVQIGSELTDKVLLQFAFF